MFQAALTRLKYDDNNQYIVFVEIQILKCWKFERKDLNEKLNIYSNQYV